MDGPASGAKGSKGRAYCLSRSIPPPDTCCSPQSNGASPYLRLLPMLLGLGSPGTMSKVAKPFSTLNLPSSSSLLSSLELSDPNPFILNPKP